MPGRSNNCSSFEITARLPIQLQRERDTWSASTTGKISQPLCFAAQRPNCQDTSHRPADGPFCALRFHCGRRPVGPWLVSSLVLPKLFEPRIAKRFEAGAEEDRAVAQAIKLGCRLAPPSHLRLVKPNRIERKIYPTKSAHTSLSPMPDVLEKPDASKERPITKTPKNERKK